MEPVLVLASASPRRAQILTSLGVAFRVSVSDVQEMLMPGEGGAAAAERLARAKAAAVGQRERLPVLAADTVVLCEGRVLGKPASVAEAADMLRLLAGRTHEVVTGVCVRARGSMHSGTERTAVTMGPMSEDEIGWYAASGEPLDKAGAYAAQGEGGRFVAEIRGSRTNVIGLPMEAVVPLLAKLGVEPA